MDEHEGSNEWTTHPSNHLLTSSILSGAICSNSPATSVAKSIQLHLG